MENRMKKLLFCLLFSSAVYAAPQPVVLVQQPMAAVSKADERDEFDSMADEMDAHGLTNTIEIKEPSAFQMFIRRVGGPIVMAYVKMREKMSAFWAWLWKRNKNKKKAQV